MKIIFYIFYFPLLIMWYIIKYFCIFTYKFIKYIYENIQAGHNNNNNNIQNDIKKLIDPVILPSLERDAKSRKKTNRNLVQITTHDGSCDKCKIWENKILNDDVFTNLPINKKYELLSNAIKNGLFHEGCKHGITTYYPELEGTKYDEYEEGILMIDESTGEVLGKIKK